RARQAIQRDSAASFRQSETHGYAERPGQLLPHRERSAIRSTRRSCVPKAAPYFPLLLRYFLTAIAADRSSRRAHAVVILLFPFLWRRCAFLRAKAAHRPKLGERCGPWSFPCVRVQDSSSHPDCGKGQKRAVLCAMCAEPFSWQKIWLRAI